MNQQRYRGVTAARLVATGLAAGLVALAVAGVATAGAVGGFRQQQILINFDNETSFDHACSFDGSDECTAKHFDAA